MQPLNPVDMVRGSLKDAVQDVVEFRGETTVVVDLAKIEDVCLFFRDTEGLEYNFLEDITAVDYFPQEPRFAMCYHLYSMIYNRRIRLKAYLPGDDPRIHSVTSIWPAANFQE